MMSLCHSILLSSKKSCPSNPQYLPCGEALEGKRRIIPIFRTKKGTARNGPFVLSLWHMTILVQTALTGFCAASFPSAIKSCVCSLTKFSIPLIVNSKVSSIPA